MSRARASVAVAATVGLVLGVTSGAPWPARLLHVAGYPVACAVIARFVPVVRERRLAWFAAHEAAMAAVALGWAAVPRWPAVAVNGAWLVAAAAWWALSSSRARTPRPGPGS